MTLVRSVKARMTYCLVVVNSSFSSSLTPFSGLGGIRKYSAASSFRGSDLLGFLLREVYDGWHRACGLGSCDLGKDSRAPGLCRVFRFLNDPPKECTGEMGITRPLDKFWGCPLKSRQRLQC